MCFSGIVARGDINKEEDIVSTNNRLEKYCKGNEFIFINNSNIDASCSNKSKLHLNRKGTSYLANNFRNHIFNIKWNIYDSVKHEKALECLCISPMCMKSDNDSETALRLNRSKYSRLWLKQRNKD